MALASLTVDLTLGLAKFEADSGKAAQIVTRDSEKMSRAALAFTRQLERQAQQAGKSNAELLSIKAATLGLGEDTLKLIEKVQGSGGAFATAGAQGVAAFGSVGVAAKNAATTTDSLLSTIVSKIREVNSQAAALKSQAVTQNQAGSLSDDGLKVKLASINAVREATLKQINETYTQERAALQLAANEAAAAETRRAAAQKIIDAQNGLTSSYRAQLLALRELRDAGAITPAQFKQAGADLVAKQPVVQDRAKEVAAAKAVQDAEAQLAATRAAAGQAFIQSLALQNFELGKSAEARQRLKGIELGVQPEADEQIRLAGQFKFIAGLNEQVAAQKLVRQELGKTEQQLLSMRAAEVGLREETAQTIAQIGALKAANEKAQKAANFTTGLDEQIAKVRQLTAEFGKTTTQVLELRAAQLGVGADSAGRIAELKAAQEAYDKVALAAKRAEAAKAGADAFVSRVQEQIAAQQRLAAEFGKTEIEVLQLQAAERGLGEALAPAIAQLKALKESNAALGAGPARASDADAFIADLIREREEAGKTREQLLALKAARLGIDTAVSGPAIAGAGNAEFLAGIEAQIAAQKRLAAEFGKTEAEVLALRAAERGLGDQTQASIAKLDALTKANRDLAAAKAAADAKRAGDDQFIQSLERQIAISGKARSEIIAMELAERGLTERGAPLLARLKDLDAATGQLGKRAFASRNQLLTLQYTISDVIASAGSGISPLTILLQQGGQVFDAFGGAAAQGKGGFFKNFFGAITGLLTPARLAIGGVAAALGTLAYAFVQGTKQSREFADAIVLSGNYAGQTEGKFNALAERIAASGKINIATAREAAQAVISTGQIGPENVERAAEAAAGYARATGKAAKDVAAEFAGLATDVTAGAIKLNQSLNFLTAAQIQQIRSLQDQGKEATAVGLVFDALAARTKKTEENLTILDKIVLGLTNDWKLLGNAIVGAFRNETIDDQLGKVQERLKLAQAQATAPPIVGKGAFIDQKNAEIAALKEEERAILRVKDRQDGAAAAAAATAALDKRVIAADEFVRGFEKRSKAVSGLNRELAEANRMFAAQDARAASDSNYKPSDAATRKAILAKIKDDYTDKSGANSAAREQGQIEKATRDQAIKELDAMLRAERAAYTFQNSYLQGLYSQSLISLDDYYAQRRAAAERDDDVQQEHFAGQIAILKKYLAASKDPSEKISTQTAINDTQAQADAAQIERQRRVIIATQEEDAARKALTDRVIEYRAQLLQLEGDETAAASIRRQQIIETAKSFQVTTSGSEVAISDEDIERQQKALELLDAFNALQRDTNQLLSAAATAEESYTLVAVQRGASLSETEKGIYEVRKRALEQLGELARKAKELADQSSDPRVIQAAADLALQYAKAVDEIDPALNRLRDSVKSTADAITDDIGAAINEFKGFGDLAKAIEKDLLRAGTKLFVTDPLKVSLEGSLKGLSEGDNPIGNLLKGIVGVQGTKDVAGQTAQTAAVATSTTALIALTNAASAASVALSAKVGPSIFSEAGKFSGSSTDPSAANYENSLDLLSSAAKTGAVAVREGTDALATSTIRAGSALNTLPAVVGQFGNYINSLLASAGSASSSGGGFFDLLAGLFKGGSSGGIAGNDISLAFHSGGMVGAGGSQISVPRGVFTGATKYHDGATVGGPSVAGLAANEVPAILMGGPRGTREEVLHASDPRHADNLSPELVRLLKGAGGKQIVLAPKFHSGGTVSSNKASTAFHASIFNSATRYHSGGIVGTPRIFQSVTRYHSGGVVGQREIPVVQRSGSAWPGKAAATQAAPTQAFYINVQAVEGMTRASAQQQGKEIGYGIQKSMRRLG